MGRSRRTASFTKRKLVVSLNLAIGGDAGGDPVTALSSPAAHL
jgi:hypothetical protein